MNLLGIVRIAAGALVRNRSRSLLTMLGIVIGVAAVIVTVAIGSGARASVANQINGLGSNLLMILPGSLNQGGLRTGTGASSTLTIEDGLAIAALPHVAAVSPSISLRTQVVAGANNWQTVVTGVAPTYTYIRDWPMAEGTFFTQNDVASAAKVCALGTVVANQLFGDGVDPVGKSVLIRNVPFLVVGVLSSKGQSGVGQDQDDSILIPYTSAMQRLTGQTVTLGALAVSASSPSDVATAQSEIVTLLEARHHLAPGTQDDFSIRNLQDVATAAASTAQILQLLLAGVAAVSLIVGGIGIMNIMLVSVSERTREIGLRVAVGARRRSILAQFLVESALLSTLGGIAGVAIGAICALGIALGAHWPTSVSPLAVLTAVAFASLVGVFFGYYPAAKAAQLEPIAALRFE
jgi:putative ABC transport system permease protein